MEDLREIAEKLEILKEDIHDNAIEHGWYDEPRTFGDMIALCHSELSEALEDFRNDRKTKAIWKDEKGKPCGIPTELADVIIRVLDMCGYYGIDIGKAVMQKHEYNKSRPYRHGNKII